MPSRPSAACTARVAAPAGMRKLRAVPVWNLTSFRQGVISIPANQQGFGRRAGDGPAADEGVEVGSGVNAQNQDAQGRPSAGSSKMGTRTARWMRWLCCPGRSPETLSDPTSRFRRRAGNDGGDRFRPGGNRHSHYAPGIEQKDPIVLTVRLVLVDPRLNLALRSASAGSPGSDVSGRRRVSGTAWRHPQPLLAKLCQFANLQIPNRGELALYPARYRFS